MSVVFSVFSCAPSYVPPSYADTNLRESPMVVGDDWPLPGVVTCPADAERHPAVVMVGGSGGVNMDAAIGPNKPFRDIALGLSSRGICVLRYDKRKAAHRERVMANVETLTIVDDTIDDAVMAIEVAKTHPLIDQKAIFVLGHSLGGYAIPRIAAKSTIPCGFIVMASTVRPLERMFVPQMQRFARIDGDVSAEEAAAIAEAEAAEVRVSQLRPGVRMDRMLLPGHLPVAYWLDLKANPATEYARRLTRPVLVLQGARDINVDIEELGGWRHYLGHNPFASYKGYPTLNHLFMVSDGKTGTEENLEPGNVAQEVIEDLAAWTRQQATSCTEAARMDAVKPVLPLGRPSQVGALVERERQVFFTSRRHDDFDARKASPTAVRHGETVFGIRGHAIPQDH